MQEPIDYESIDFISFPVYLTDFLLVPMNSPERVVWYEYE